MIKTIITMSVKFSMIKNNNLNCAILASSKFSMIKPYITVSPKQ